ncbi:MAG: alpha-glucan family phosphorylase, partial [Bacteroidota bacterium]
MTGQITDTHAKLRRIYIKAQLPEELSGLHRLAGNLWWSWNKEASELFKSIDHSRFIELNYNPVALLDQLSPEKVAELAADKDFLSKLQQCEQDFDAYLGEAKAEDQPRIAYFSMEYGLHYSLRLYSGGLGVLAGDYLKEASDSNVDLFGVGLLYRYGYFNQALSKHGDQIHQFPAQEFTKMPIEPVRRADGEWLKIQVSIRGRIVRAKVWKLPVGRINLFLLDTDFDENSWEDRALTHQLYGGDNEHRLKQEILLGIGGVRAIEAMGLQPDLYHLNEGHAGFLSMERLANLVDRDFSYEEAKEIVRATSLYTTHTPVPAGHDQFSEPLLREYLYDFAGKLGIEWSAFVGLGRTKADNPAEPFNMSKLSIRLSQRVNGVSKLHGDVSQEMFTPLYDGYVANELHIGYVTNSVHYPTWIANRLHHLYNQHFGKGWLRDQSNPDRWRNIHQVADKDLFDIRQALKHDLLEYVREKLQADMRRRGESPRDIFNILNGIDEKALVFGFARRFATYKRATLLFSNKERLRELVNQAGRPVLFLFAGKAHPADEPGQNLIRQIVQISKEPDFAGKVIFLEDYNMEMAKLLVRGVDVWLNTPTRPKEASGTSGMKAALNGSINFSVLDGWWAEGYRPDAGWALPLEKTYEDQHLQNELDAETIYNILEDEIIPIYFDRDADDVPTNWMSYVKQIIAEVAPQFTMKRMLDDYYERFYNPLYESAKAIRSNDFQPARDFAAWKRHVERAWPKIQVVSFDAPDTANHPLPVGQDFNAKLKLKLNDLEPHDVLLETVFFKRSDDEHLELRRKETPASFGSILISKLTIPFSETGSKVSLRRN